MKSTHRSSSFKGPDRRSVSRRRAMAGIAEPPTTRRQRTALPAPSASEVARMKQLRAEGNSYAAVDDKMGYPDSHGGRTWYALNVPKAYGPRDPNPPRATRHTSPSRRHR